MHDQSESVCAGQKNARCVWMEDVCMYGGTRSFAYLYLSQHVWMYISRAILGKIPLQLRTYLPPFPTYIHTPTRIPLLVHTYPIGISVRTKDEDEREERQYLIWWTIQNRVEMREGFFLGKGLHFRLAIAIARICNTLCCGVINHAHVKKKARRMHSTVFLMCRIYT